MTTTLITYVMFNGNCKEALRFYEDALEAIIEMQLTYGGSPMADSLPPEHAGKIMHARIRIKDQVLMASDCMPSHSPFEGMHGFRLNLSCDEPEEAQRLFDILAAGGSIEMPLQSTFWAKAFGMLTDRFGLPWMINCEEVA